MSLNGIKESTKEREALSVGPVISAKDQESQLRELEIKARQLELLEREANLQDIQERLGERQLARENHRQKAITQGQVLKQQNRDIASAQKRCNHLKGGVGPLAVTSGHGRDTQYAVIKHRYANNDLWVICLRCGKKWKPPIRKSFETESAYAEALAEYKVACLFHTLNSTSTSQQYSWSDNGEYYREVMENS